MILFALLPFCVIVISFSTCVRHCFDDCKLLAICASFLDRFPLQVHVLVFAPALFTYIVSGVSETLHVYDNVDLLSPPWGLQLACYVYWPVGNKVSFARAVLIPC